MWIQILCYCKTWDIKLASSPMTNKTLTTQLNNSPWIMTWGILDHVFPACWAPGLAEVLKCWLAAGLLRWAQSALAGLEALGFFDRIFLVRRVGWSWMEAMRWWLWNCKNMVALWLMVVGEEGRWGRGLLYLFATFPGTHPFKSISCPGQDDPVIVIPHNIFQFLLTRLLLTKM